MGKISAFPTDRIVILSYDAQRKEDICAKNALCIAKLYHCERRRQASKPCYRIISSLSGIKQELYTRPGEVNRIAVAVVGSDFVFFINNKVVGQMTADIDPGQIGLGVDALSSADDAQVIFSDFQINAP